MDGPTHPHAGTAAPTAAQRPATSVVPDDVVLDAAAALLMTIGVRRTTLAEVARQAGVSRMTLYRRWPDLRSLVRDVMTREWARIVVPGAMAAGDGETGTDPAATRAELVRSLVATAQAFQSNPLFLRICATDGELLAPYILERLGTTQLLVLDLLRERLAAARAVGAVRAGDPAAQARMVLLATQSYVLSAGALGDEVARETLAHELYLMLDGYLSPPDPEGPPPVVEGPPPGGSRPAEHREHPGAQK
ncbi:TetR/AcrR family transcriptional regulator [Frankia sp. R43]|uniref:TetR/AcrR family transcriptional regulator n=1 Tax=Frankia sp. R43 TaxID=269536 RepID=UPI0006CA3DB9|nr:TetR/AcrR family transcriptional regulator [Frankia sp. R43]